MNQTDKFIDYLFNLKNFAFTDNIIIQAKRCLLDYLGVTLAGAFLLHKKENRILNFSDCAVSGITAIGLNRKTDIYTATLINGLSSHVAELDDGIRYGVIHPGSPIFSTLLALAEKEKINGKRFITATILAYEAGILLASAIQPTHYNMGYHPTATCGAIGATIGAAVILGYNKKQFKDAFSAAAISASGTLKVIEDGSELKPYNAGMAALNGLVSSIVAGSDFSGPLDVLSGSTGFFAMMSKENSFQIPTTFDNLLIEKVYVKPYAACRHAHPSIEAAIKIRNAINLKLEDIHQIRIRTYKGVIGKHDIKTITNANSAKMSIPFSVAIALKKGKAGIEEFSESNIHDSQILTIVNKTNIVTDEELSILVPHKRSAILEIEFNNGDVISERIDFPKGEPENPMTNKELEDKFLNLAKFANKSVDISNQIIAKVWNLETEMSHLFDLI